MHVAESPYLYMVLDNLLSIAEFILPPSCALNMTSAIRYMAILLRVATLKRHGS